MSPAFDTADRVQAETGPLPQLGLREKQPLSQFPYLVSVYLQGVLLLVGVRSELYLMSKTLCKCFPNLPLIFAIM